ncbi:hypothetical protein HID58_068041 [Brassica napus]|uniref:Alpha-D-phosphohexomutase alpha/beta/alpha domain-containing protein n=1 Tax=Brassica napus TaxID=3708 RepID=A0ABQ7ZK98_BRANA|nr:hypothetical protein HID58_068041 [Brassica napus]
MKSVERRRLGRRFVEKRRHGRRFVDGDDLGGGSSTGQRSRRRCTGEKIPSIFRRFLSSSSFFSLHVTKSIDHSSISSKSVNEITMEIWCHQDFVPSTWFHRFGSKTRCIRKTRERGRTWNQINVIRDKAMVVPGVEGEPVSLPEPATEAIAAAFGQWLLHKKNVGSRKLRVSVGHDSRISAPTLLEAVSRGLGLSGLDVVQSAAVDSSGREFNRNRLIALLSAIFLEQIRVSGFGGWFLLRLSLHDPFLPLNIEAQSEDDAVKLGLVVANAVKEFNALDTSALSSLTRS